MSLRVAPLSRLLLLLAIVASSSTAHGQYSRQFDRWEVHYSVVNSTFLAPETAARYGIVRGRDRAILNHVRRPTLRKDCRWKSRQAQISIKSATREARNTGGNS